MDQETAKRLLAEGGTFVFLGVPEETQFGIDMQCWNTAEDFRGIKMIPPGLHYIHYSPVSPSTSDIGPRSGFMHYFTKQEFLVKLWDKQAEDISMQEVTEESVQRLRDNLLNLDRYLAPYPYENWQKWKLLTSQISAEVAAELSPPSGIIRASVDLLPTTDADRPKGVKAKESSMQSQASSKMSSTGSQEAIPKDSMESQEATQKTSSTETPESSKDSPMDSQEPTSSMTIEATASEVTSTTEDVVEPLPGQSDAKRAKRITREEQEEAMLPKLKPAPGAELRFTKIPRDKYPPGATPEEITKHYLDQSYTLELMMAQHSDPLFIIGEMQFAYLCFLIGHSLEAFEHWKNLVILLCSCDEAISKHRSIFFQFIRTIETQIDEMPQEFLADIVMNKNLIYKKLREFFRTVYIADVDARLRSMIEKLKNSLTEKLEWDFSDLDLDEEDERPVVVNIHDERGKEVTT